MSEPEKPKERQSPNWEIIEQIFRDIKSIKNVVETLERNIYGLDDRLKKLESEAW
jgi:predicted RNase H-like nuclease (RuvC/YqgF family)